jgi:hypothetical protein
MDLFLKRNGTKMTKSPSKKLKLKKKAVRKLAETALGQVKGGWWGIDVNEDEDQDNTEDTCGSFAHGTGFSNHNQALRQ